MRRGLGLALLAWLLLLAPAAARTRYRVGPGGLACPTDVTVDASGHLVVAEFGRPGISRLRADGKLIPGPKGPPYPWRLASDPRGRVWLSDPVDNLVGCYLPDGHFRDLPVDVSAPAGLVYCAKRHSLFVVERFGRLLELDPRTGRIRKVVAVGMDGAEGLTMQGTRLFVSFPAQGRVVQFDLATGHRRLIADGLSLPTGLVATRSSLFVAETQSGSVWQYSLSNLARRLAGETSPGITGLVLDGKHLVASNLLDGSVWSIDPVTGAKRAIVTGGAFPGGSLRFELEDRLFACGLTPVEFDTAGHPVYAPLLASLYGRPEQFMGIVASALADDGQVYYSLSKSGMIVTGWGDRVRVVAEGLDRPAGLVVGRHGTIFVAESGAGRVVAVIPGGGVVPIDTALDEPVDLARAPGGGLVVVDRAAGRLLVLGSSSPRVVCSGLAQPTAVAMLPDGQAAVLEAGADRVVSVSLKTGRQTLLYQAAHGMMQPPRGTPWQVIGGLAVDPVRQTLYVSVPGKRAIVTVPLTSR